MDWWKRILNRNFSKGCSQYKSRCAFKYKSTLLVFCLSFVLSSTPLLAQEKKPTKTQGHLRSQTATLLNHLETAKKAIRVQDESFPLGWNQEHWKVLVFSAAAYSQILEWRDENLIEERLSQLFDLEFSTRLNVARRFYGTELDRSEIKDVLIDGEIFRFIPVDPILRFLIFPDKKPEQYKAKKYTSDEVYRNIAAKVFFIENSKGEIVGFESWQNVEMARVDDNEDKEATFFLETKPAKIGVQAFEDWRMGRARQFTKNKKVLLWFHSAVGDAYLHPAYLMGLVPGRIKSKDKILKSILHPEDEPMDGYFYGGPGIGKGLRPRQIRVDQSIEKLRMLPKQAPKSVIHLLAPIFDTDGRYSSLFREDELYAALSMIRDLNISKIALQDQVDVENMVLRMTGEEFPQDISEFAFSTLQKLGIRQKSTRDHLLQKYLYFVETMILMYEGDSEIFRTNVPMTEGMLGDTLYYYPQFEKFLLGVLEKDPKFLNDVSDMLYSEKFLKRFTAVLLLSQTKKFDGKLIILNSINHRLRDLAQDFRLAVTEQPGLSLELIPQLGQYGSKLAIKAMIRSFWDKGGEDFDFERFLFDNNDLGSVIRTERPKIFQRYLCQQGFRRASGDGL